MIGVGNKVEIVDSPYTGGYAQVGTIHIVTGISTSIYDGLDYSGCNRLFHLDIGLVFKEEELKKVEE